VRRYLPWVFALVLSALVGWASYWSGHRDGRCAVHSDLDRAVLRELIRDTEGARTHLGRAPADQAELETLLGRHLPFVHDTDMVGSPTSVHYLRLDSNRFQLKYELMATDDWVYDSANPEAGWVQRWY
jgi:hypothetical protein